MDLHELWQENKRWILSCVAGLLLFWIAHSVIGTYFDDANASSRIQRMIKAIKKEQYRKGELNQAREEQARVHEVFDKVHKAMHMPVPDTYRLQGKGDPELYWVRRRREVTDHLMNITAEANVELAETAFRWPKPVAPDEIQRSLIGLCVLDQAVQRIVEAHRRVTGADLEAVGLRTIKRLQIMSVQRSPRVRRRRTRGEEDQKLPADFVRSYRLSFDFDADYRTTHRFLESCRQSDLPLGLDDLTIELGRRPGDPVKVKCKLVALVVAPLEE